MMTNSLSIIERDGVAVVDSRDVASWVGKKHFHLMRDVDTYAEVLSTESKFGLSDFFIPNTYKDVTGRSLPCYFVTRKGCEMIANKMTGQKGILFTAAYIEKFHEYEERVKARSQVQTPQDYISALKALVASEEEKLRLQQEAEANRPKILFADSVSASSTSILVGEMAKLLKQNGIDTGQQRFFAWLRENGYLIKRKGTDYNMPTQKSMELGLFEIKETAITKPDGKIHVTKTPKITGKGQQYFMSLFLTGKADMV